MVTLSFFVAGDRPPCGQLWCTYEAYLRPYVPYFGRIFSEQN